MNGAKTFQLLGCLLFFLAVVGRNTPLALLILWVFHSEIIVVCRSILSSLSRGFGILREVRWVAIAYAILFFQNSISLLLNYDNSSFYWLIF